MIDFFQQNLNSRSWPDVRGKSTASYFSTDREMFLLRKPNRMWRRQ